MHAGRQQASEPATTAATQSGLLTIAKMTYRLTYSFELRVFRLGRCRKLRCPISGPLRCLDLQAIQRVFIAIGSGRHLYLRTCMLRLQPLASHRAPPLSDGESVSRTAYRSDHVSESIAVPFNLHCLAQTLDYATISAEFLLD